MVHGTHSAHGKNVSHERFNQNTGWTQCHCEARWADYTPTQCAQWHEAHSPWPEGTGGRISQHTPRVRASFREAKTKLWTSVKGRNHQGCMVSGPYLSSMFLQTPPGTSDLEQRNPWKFIGILRWMKWNDEFWIEIPCCKNIWFWMYSIAVKPVKPKTH